MTPCVNGKGIPSATPENLSTHRRISVDKMCYRKARFGRQKEPVNRKYGHDLQGVIKLCIEIFGKSVDITDSWSWRQLATVAVRG